MLEFNDSELSMTDGDISGTIVIAHQSREKEDHPLRPSNNNQEEEEENQDVRKEEQSGADVVQEFTIDDNDDDSDAVQAFDNFEEDDSEEEGGDEARWKKEKEKEIEERKSKHEKERKAKREEENKLSQATSIKPADQRKYKKAFDKWCDDDGNLPVENMKDLFLSLSGKLKLNVTDDELQLFLTKMNVQEDQETVTLEKFMEGVAARDEITTGGR